MVNLLENSFDIVEVASPLFDDVFQYRFIRSTEFKILQPALIPQWIKKI